ncbi:MAG: EamA family transporter [Aestuariivirgaceae bacterium]
MSLRAKDYVMGVAVALTWGMGIVFAKAAIEHFPPILLMAFRFAITAMILVWFVKPPIGQISKIFGIAIISAAIQYSMTFTGLKGLDASVTALVVQLEVPFLVLLGAVFLQEAPGLPKWIGIAIAFAGVALIAGEPKLDGAWVPMFLVIGGAFTWAIGQVLVRTLKDLDGLTILAWVAVCASPQLFVMSAIFESDHVEAVQSAGLVVWAAVIYLGIVMNGIGYGMWYTLVSRHPVSRVAPFLLLLPVFSMIGGVAFLGEGLSWQVAAGGAIVLAGVAAIVLEREDDEFDDEEAIAGSMPEMGGAPVLKRHHTWPDGSRYEGEWLNGQAHGFGTMEWSNRTAWPGDRYEGEWSDGLLDGAGTYFRADGTRLAGIWQRGEKID